MLSTKNLQLPAFQNKKLAPKWVGPFRILQKVGSLSYKLDLPGHLKLHNVFHVTLLKKYIGTPPNRPAPITIEG